jgi:hypothetical protein
MAEEAYKMSFGQPEARRPQREDGPVRSDLPQALVLMVMVNQGSFPTWRPISVTTDDAGATTRLAVVLATWLDKYSNIYAGAKKIERVPFLLPE